MNESNPIPQTPDYHKSFASNQLTAHNKIANFIKWVVQATGNKIERIGSYIRHLGKKYKELSLAERSICVRVNSAKDMHYNNYLMLGSNKNFKAYRKSLEHMREDHPEDSITLCGKNHERLSSTTDVHNMVKDIFSQMLAEKHGHFGDTKCKEIKIIVEAPPFITKSEMTESEYAYAYTTACEAWMLHMQTEYKKKVTVLSCIHPESQEQHIRIYDETNAKISAMAKNDRENELKEYIRDYILGIIKQPTRVEFPPIPGKYDDDPSDHNTGALSQRAIGDSRLTREDIHLFEDPNAILNSLSSQPPTSAQSTHDHKSGDPLQRNTLGDSGLTREDIHWFEDANAPKKK